MRKWWLLGTGVLLVAAAVIVYFNWDTKKEVAAAAAVTTRVIKGTIEVNVSGTGSIAPAAKETVKSGKQGTIGEVKVKLGDKVKKGDVLASLEGEDNTDKIKSEEVSLEKKLLQLQSTQDQFKTETDDKNISSLKLSMKQQQLDIEQSRDTIADLKEATAEETIVAPVAGTVTTLSVADGDMLNGSAELAVIADYDHFNIVVGIDELDISKVKAGQTAKVTIEALAGQTFTGKVTDIADEGTASNGVASFDVTIALDSAEGLKSGMSAEASIQVDKKENTLMLPIDAVQSMGGRYMVILPAAGQSGAAAGPGRADGQTSGSTAGSKAAGGSGGASSGQTGAADNGADGSPAAGQGGAAGSGSANGQTGDGAAGGSAGATRDGSTGGQTRAATGGQGQIGGQTGGGQTGGRSGQGGAAAQSRFGGTPQMIEVGIHNEDYIEVLSGLTEGQQVVVPTVISTATAGAQQQAGAGGFGGLGGIGGGGGFGGGIPGGGGFGGGGGGQRSGGAAPTGGGGAR
ncbi:efflux RND transporter periplasmic adaptor subunit [Paenibacillus nasutitermitis]|uniref:HlyD family secretion protein n=1 Tax=Paenibacillus nasutitermitis TaxID=1652958 RepID=A0A916YJI8_9BACL|nr:efflux RND transporter periplasmic adaptor subunit [Paenibacillus nasutitermitis]GGD46660.1 hypothetical protein GCM10010911_00180 [Paenibacillus nasutitermitis]